MFTFFELFITFWVGMVMAFAATSWVYEIKLQEHYEQGYKKGLYLNVVRRSREED